jgi:hypothetical protein
MSTDIYFHHRRYAKCGRMLNQPDEVVEAVRANYSDEDSRKRAGIHSLWGTLPGQSLPIFGRARDGWSPSDDHYSNP